MAIIHYFRFPYSYESIILLKKWRLYFLFKLSIFDLLKKMEAYDHRKCLCYIYVHYRTEMYCTAVFVPDSVLKAIRKNTLPRSSTDTCSLSIWLQRVFKSCSLKCVVETAKKFVSFDVYDILRLINPPTHNHYNVSWSNDSILLTVNNIRKRLQRKSLAQLQRAGSTLERKCLQYHMRSFLHLATRITNRFCAVKGQRCSAMWCLFLHLAANELQEFHNGLLKTVCKTNSELVWLHLSFNTWSYRGSHQDLGLHHLRKYGILWLSRYFVN